jgi:phenylacetate-CoA ligase
MIGLSFLEADKLSNANAIKYLRVIDRVKPAILEGYVSSLVEIVRIGSKLGIRVQPPGAVVTTAETLFPHDRRVLSDYFETEIFDDYGSSEVESIAFECPTHSGMHVAADHVILETGDDGRVILTDLDNHAMPFVRYENGDAAEWTRRSCPCGRSSPLLARVLGRQSERVIGPNGNRVHDVFFAHLLEDYGWIERYGVEQFQVVQESLDLFLFRLIVLRQPRINDERILTNIMRRFLGDIRVQYEYPTAIPPSAAGKRQSVISHLSPRQS